MFSLFFALFCTFFAVGHVLSLDTLDVINNDGSMWVNWQRFGFTGYGDPKKPNSNYIRTCGDISDLLGTKDLYYIVKMGIFKDYILPKTGGVVFTDTCIVVAGSGRYGCADFKQCQPYMYSPYDPNDVDKFNIEDVVVDVEHVEFSDILGFSQEGITKDGRKTISSWGAKHRKALKGGCCRSTNNTKEEKGWGKPYRLTAAKLNMNYLYLHTPKLNGSASSFTINSKVTDIYMRSGFSDIHTNCTWEIKDVDTGANVAVTAVNCVLATTVTAAADKKYSVTVTITPSSEQKTKTLWKTNSKTATAYVVVPKSSA